MRELGVFTIWKPRFDQLVAERDSLRTQLAETPTATQVFEAIAHGDETHREWLREACDNLWAGKPVPPPRGKNTDADLQTQLAEAVGRLDRELVHKRTLENHGPALCGHQPGYMGTMRTTEDDTEVVCKPCFDIMLRQAQERETALLEALAKWSCHYCHGRKTNPCRCDGQACRPGCDTSAPCRVCKGTGLNEIAARALSGEQGTEAGR